LRGWKYLAVRFRLLTRQSDTIMTVAQRIDALTALGEYLREAPTTWTDTLQRASLHNPWFTTEFTTLAANNIASHFLQPRLLREWAAHYHLDDNIGGKNVGIVMAGNIPLVGFHDFLSVFLSGHRQTIKCAEKDNILLRHLVETLIKFAPESENRVRFADMLKGCDAYIATGSDNTARYFEQYFAQYPHIIRRNRTSVAILTGDETTAELDALSDDIHLYFGRGCRNVTQLLVPRHYDFIPLLKASERYAYFAQHDKYKNNYDYYLTIQIMNNRFYMTSNSILLIESEELFPPISQLHYRFYDDKADMVAQLSGRDDIQCIAGKDFIPFGKAQTPALTDYADGVDTLQFLLTL
jgi:hypothetical protein